jgi:hypothetical protein
MPLFYAGFALHVWKSAFMPGGVVLRPEAHWQAVSEDIPHLPQKQRVVMLKPAIDGLSSGSAQATVVETVTVVASRGNAIEGFVMAQVLDSIGRGGAI